MADLIPTNEETTEPAEVTPAPQTDSEVMGLLQEILGHIQNIQETMDKTTPVEQAAEEVTEEVTEEVSEEPAAEEAPDEDLEALDAQLQRK